MDRSDNPEGSIRGARERAEAALRMNDQRQYGTGTPNSGQPRPPRPQALQGRTGPIGDSISRPTQVPQWPLAGPLPSSTTPSDSSQSQQRRQQPPPRPPRPSRVHSILDSSRVQDPTPVFQYQPQSVRDSDQTFTSSVPPTPSSVQTNSTIASIPDFPLPVAAAPPAMPPARRSVTLGPPPSARRGASSFYSTLSYVSPIPEESPRTRSYTSLASSAAMPESFGSPSPGLSPAYPEAFYGDMMRDDDRQVSNNGDADEGGLVRSASIGKRGKPQIVINRGAAAAGPSQRPQPRPVQGDNPFTDGTFFTEASSSESVIPVKSTTPPNIGEAIETDPVPPPRRMSTSPSRMSYNRLSAIRRPPRLDMEAVEKAQARGSMTSLPDLIRRATRLAAMIDIGKRPGSRFDDYDYPDEKGGGQGLDRFSTADDRHQSGLSDMLAAFPPPAQATSRASRVGSWFRNSTSWPLPTTREDAEQPRVGGADSFNNRGPAKTNRKRRLCGLPLWGFIILVLVVIGIIAAAILVPLQFFVFRNRDGPLGNGALAACRTQLTCENGGTNVVARDVCSCICTNGFTGSNCAVAGSAGCTTTNLVNMDESPNIDNVTLGQAIPRLLAEAQGNFSVPLSGTQILARFNTDSLSCTAQNSLVTFDGRSMRTGAAQAAILAGQFEDDAAVRAAAFVSVSVITVLPAQFVAESTISGFFTLPRVTTLPGGFVRTLPPLNNAILPPTTTTTVTTTLPSVVVAPPTPGPTFAVSEEVLDFARVAVLFILQENDVDEASQAQSTLQRFFSNSGGSVGMSMDSAASLDLGNGNAVDLVNLRVDVGSGAVGGRASRKRALEVGRVERRVPRACLNVDQL